MVVQTNIEQITQGYSGLAYTGSKPRLGIDTVVLVLSGPVLQEPTRTSIQIGNEGHVEDVKGAMVNHSCDPTCKVIKLHGSWVLITVKPVDVGDQITFNYNDSETSMSSPFVCHCCNRKIVGNRVSSLQQFNVL